MVLENRHALIFKKKYKTDQYKIVIKKFDNLIIKINIEIGSPV